MADPKGCRLYVNLSASQARRRLSGFGHGVRKIHSAGHERAVIIHTATGQHFEELKAEFADVGFATTEDGMSQASQKAPTRQCWNCQQEIPHTAEFCPHCQAKVVEEPPADAKDVIESILGSLGPDAMDELREAFERCETSEEFVNRIMIGDCPKCGSSKTSHCENEPEINDPCVARCLDCGQLWCADCGEFFKDGQAGDHDCPAWEDIDLDGED
jgi:hypothetical protein